MDKKAFDWGELAKDKRLIGAGLAGLGGALVGGGVLPGLIYKKPTKGSRLLLGGTSGVLTALATLAALRGDEKNSQESLPKQVSGAGRHITDILFPGPMSADAKREMGWLGRTLAGKEKNLLSGGVRLTAGGLPDIGGILGKTKAREEAEKSGEVPAYDYPNRGLAAARAALNAWLGIGVGKAHYTRLNEQLRNKKIAEGLSNFWKNVGPEIRKELVKSPYSNALKKDLNTLALLEKAYGNSSSWKEFGQSAKKSLMEVPKQLPILGRFLKQKKALNPSLSSFNRFEHSEQLLNRLSRNISNEKAREALNTLSQIKPGRGAKLWHGIRGTGRGLLVAGLLAAVQRGLGAKDTRYMDVGEDLYKGLKPLQNQK